MVKRLLICAVLMMPLFSVLAQDALPRDVQRFVNRRGGCDHLRGEHDRMSEPRIETRRLCSGTDRELARLKRKYAANSTIMQILNQFEVSIEAAEVSAPKSNTAKRAG